MEITWVPIKSAPLLLIHCCAEGGWEGYDFRAHQAPFALRETARKWSQLINMALGTDRVKSRDCHQLMVYTRTAVGD